DVPPRARGVLRHVEGQHPQGEPEEVEERDQVREHRAPGVEGISDGGQREPGRARDGATHHRGPAALPAGQLAQGGLRLAHGRLSLVNRARSSAGASASGAFWLSCSARRYATTAQRSCTSSSAAYPGMSPNPFAMTW